MKFLLIAAVVATVLCCSKGQVSEKCRDKITEAAYCSMRPVRNCFERHGCEYPDFGSYSPRGGKRNCMHRVMQVAGPYIEECMNTELPGVPKHFFYMAKNAMTRIRFGSRSEMRAQLKQMMREVVNRQCGSAAPNVLQCLENMEERQPVKYRIRNCVNRINRDCRQELKGALCRCIDNTLQNEPQLLSDGIECYKRSRKSSSPLNFLLNEDTVRTMIDSFCSSNSGFDDQGGSRGNPFRQLLERLRNRPNSRGGDEPTIRSFANN